MGCFSRERPNGLLLVAFQISGSISGRPILLGCRSAVQTVPSRVSTIRAVSVYRLTMDGVHFPSSFSSFMVSMMARPQSIRPFSPLHRAAAAAGEWNRIRQPIASSAESVANTQPYFSSSRQALAYSATRRLSATSRARLSRLPPVPTKPSNILRAASTSTAF